MSLDEKQADYWEYHFQNLINETWDSLQLIDLPFEGLSFTWTNLQDSSYRIQECLDRFVANVAWHQLHPKVCVSHLTPSVSDHKTSLLHTYVVDASFPKPFRFRNFWTNIMAFNQLSLELGHSVVGCPPFFVSTKLSQVKHDLRQLSKAMFGGLDVKIHKISDSLSSQWGYVSSASPSLVVLIMLMICRT